MHKLIHKIWPSLNRERYIFEGHYLWTSASLLAVHHSYKTKAVISPFLDITVKVKREMVKKTGCTCCTWVHELCILLSNVFAVRTSSISFLVSVTKHAQLSVIVVPVSCSLIAVILIVFGVAYYVQSKNRQVLHLCVFMCIVW